MKTKKRKPRTGEPTIILEADWDALFKKLRQENAKILKALRVAMPQLLGSDFARQRPGMMDLLSGAMTASVNIEVFWLEKLTP